MFKEVLSRLLECELELARAARDIAQSDVWRKAGYTSPTKYLIGEFGCPARIAQRALADANLIYRTANKSTRKRILDGQLKLEDARLIRKVVGADNFNATAALEGEELEAKLTEAKPEPKETRPVCRYSLRGNVFKISATLVGTDAVKAHAAIHGLLKKQFRGEAERRGMDRRRADALTSLMVGTDSAAVNASLAVIVDADPTKAGAFTTTTGATLKAAEAAALLGENPPAWVIFRDPVSLKPLLLGRSRRLASVHQRLVLMATQKTCAVKGCEVPIHKCQIHHRHDWNDGGGTDIGNLIGVCARHHGNITAGHLEV